MIHNIKTNFSFYSHVHFQKGTVEHSKTKEFYPGSCFALIADFISNFLHHGANDYWPSRLRAPITQLSLSEGLADANPKVKFNSEDDTIAHEDLATFIVNKRESDVIFQEMFGTSLGRAVTDVVKANQILDIIRKPYISGDNHRHLYNNKNTAYFYSQNYMLLRS